MKNIINQVRMRHAGDIDTEIDNENGSEKDAGFTLVEILIAIVLVGILSAVVVVGISNLTSKGNNSACSASQDAAKAGSIVYYASHNNTYPTNFLELIKGDDQTPAALTLPSNAVISGKENIVTVGSWTLTMTPSQNGAAPTFDCNNT